MASLKEIRKATLENFKSHPVYSISLSLVLVLLVIVIALLGLFTEIPDIPVFAFFLIVMPFIFATQTSHLGLKQAIDPTFSRQMRFFLGYFSVPFRGVFKVLKSLLFALLGFLATAFIISYFSGLVAASIDPQFIELQSQILVLMNEGKVEEMATFLEEHLTSFTIYYNLTFLPASFVALFIYTLSSSYNSFQLYFRIKQPILNHRLSYMIYTKAKTPIAADLRKKYWGSNFPLYILLFVGFISGVLLTSIFTIEFTYLFTFGFVGAVFAMMFFLPFYFSNMEEIYMSYHEHFKTEASKTAGGLIDSLQEQINPFIKKDKIEGDKDKVEDEKDNVEDEKDKSEE
ncbi:MAG: hypothetical protein WDA35_01950 [Bacilli bacterium]